MLIAILNCTTLGADRDIPRFQRRGAIIVLGMFAVARREIVTDRTDTLLKIGLGPLGKVWRLVFCSNFIIY